MSDPRTAAAARRSSGGCCRRHAGTHLSAERLRTRLRAHEISSLSAHGGDQGRAAGWARAAGATYADYAALGHPT